MDEVLKNYLWVEQMKQAMKIMHEACNRNESWRDCTKCPFDSYCDCLQEMNFEIPGEWTND